MKRFKTALLIIASFLCYHTVKSQTNEYDSVLAQKLNADDYGMKSYVLVLLKKGPAEITDKKLRDSIFRGHMANIMRLASENKLVLAGPMGENSKHYEGIFIFNTADTTEAKQWVNSDPAIQSGELEAEIYAWYATAVLQEIPDMHKKIQKKSF